MEENPSAESKLQRELDYYKKQADQISGESIRLDYTLSSLRLELKQKKEALSVLTDLQTEFSVTTPIATIYNKTVKAINAQLGMDHSMVLLQYSNTNVFKAAHWQGFQDEHTTVLKTGEVEISLSFFQKRQFILVNKSTIADKLASYLQKLYSLSYFIAVPILVEEKFAALIIAGRRFEKNPFVPTLNKGDVDTLTSIAGLISSIVQSKNMMELKLQKMKIEKQNKVITEQRDNLEKALNELRLAQNQLIQREKMASLGELTAGIAHEIQNPLNFVNNFSEVSNELVDEMDNELSKGDIEEAKSIARDIKYNLEKINHHGKRADAIVKDMLQHSRSSTGVIEPTDINALADEYLRLSYHGVRAKNNSYNVTTKTDFDSKIGKINVVPQDIGRALLNLYNNAFYAVAEKKKNETEDYEPAVTVSTKKKGNQVSITVSDNGNGVSKKVIDKIFQPFFTTKPTGQGTGLGLSLTFDIVKAHCAEIKVETKEGNGSKFIIELPLQ
jgi:signal transduction histidine kinase